MLYHVLPVALILFVFTGCKKEVSTSPSDPSFSVSTFYGVGINAGAIVAWNISNPYSNGVEIYRSQNETFSTFNATMIARRSTSAGYSLTDTGLTNGTRYYYTIVPYHEFNDGSREVSGNRTTIQITPKDHALIAAADIRYSEHIQPLFTNGCAVNGCHGGGVEGEHLLRKRSHGGSTFSLRSWKDALAGTDHVAQIVPFRANKSHVIQHLNRDTTVAPVAQPSMPSGFSFPIELRDLLIRWIDDGARYDDGSVAYSTMPIRGWGYVTNQGEDLTAVIDLDRNKIARYVTTGVANTSAAPPQAPHNAVVDWQNQFYYINLIGGSKLLKFRVSDNAKVGELATGISSPAQVALSQHSDTAYVSNFEDARTNISVIHTPTMTKLFDLGNAAMLKPHGVSVTPDFRHVLVMNSFSDNITIIRTSDNSIVATVPVSGSVPQLPIGYLFQFEPYQAAITPDSRFAYITCRKSGEVRVLDIDNRTIVDSIAVGSVPLIPAITPDGGYVFVANRNSNSVSAINTATRKEEYTIDNVGVEPHGVAVSKDGKFLYVSCENLGVSDPPHHPTTGGKKVGFVKIIEIAKRAVVASLETGNFGSGMAVTH